jgi:hypothetical protein
MPQNIVLADPSFMNPSCIDDIIGGAYFLDLIEEGRIKIENDQMFLRSSVFEFSSPKVLGIRGH